MIVSWVRRSTYEAIEAERREWQALAKSWKGLYDDQREIITDLLNKYHALRMQGASEPPPARVIEQPAPDPVMSAIAVASRGDRRLHTLMAQEAQRMRARGDHEFDIIAAIQQGIESPEGLPA